MDKKILIGGGVLAAGAVGYLAFAYRGSIANLFTGKASTVPAGATPRFAPASPNAPAAPTDVFSMQGPDGQVQTASSLGELRKRLLAAYGSEAAARSANVYLPGDTAWHPAGDTVFGQAPRRPILFTDKALQNIQTVKAVSGRHGVAGARGGWELTNNPRGSFLHRH